VGVRDNLITGNSNNIVRWLKDGDGVKLHTGHIRDFRLVSEVVREYDAILYHAALVGVARTVEDPLLTNEINVNGTLNLLVAAPKWNIRRFVYASSSSVYGETSKLPKKESMKTAPISPYGVSNLSGENYCKVFALVYGLMTISLRYFNVYGPRQTPGDYSGVIPRFINMSVKDIPLPIYGNGKQTRDFTYVGDVVQANLFAWKEITKLARW
jgi:nucleoside-diphosphate-sugar epimerase